MLAFPVKLKFVYSSFKLRRKILKDLQLRSDYNATININEVVRCNYSDTFCHRIRLVYKWTTPPPISWRYGPRWNVTLTRWTKTKLGGCPAKRTVNCLRGCINCRIISQSNFIFHDQHFTLSSKYFPFVLLYRSFNCLRATWLNIIWWTKYFGHLEVQCLQNKVFVTSNQYVICSLRRTWMHPRKLTDG